MDLIQSYNDQGSQSSSSGDELRFLDKTAAPSTSYSNDIATPKMVSNYEPLERIPIDRLMIATAAIATAQKPINQKQKQKQAATSFAHWVPDFEKEIYSCLGSIQVLQKHKILESMDRLISKLTTDYDKLIKPSIAASVAQYIRTYLHIYKYLFRSLEKGKRYYKRFIKILAIYTDFELSASIRGTEYDKTIAERIVLIYQSYLDHLDNSMVLDVLLNTKRLWRQHRGILALLFEYFLVRKTQLELPDTLFMKNLIMFKKWLYIEEVPEEQRKARNAFIRCVKPKKTICMNSLFKPYLPVDEEGFVTVANLNDILDKEYALAPLIRCLKKAETRLEMRQNEEIIVLTDDENDGDDSMSNQEASSITYSHHDEMSNDFDWYSASSQQGQHSSHSQNIIETVSIDSPPRNSKKTPSLSSLDSCDLNLDTTNSLTAEAEPNGEGAPHPMLVQTNNDVPSSSENVANEANGENERNLPTLNESVFNRLVNDINSTHVSIPGNTSTESSKIIENGQSRSAESSDGLQESEISETVPIENEQLNGIVSHLLEPVACSTNGNSALSSSEHDVNEASSMVLSNHVEVKLCNETETVKNCDNNVIMLTSELPLKNHEETLLNIHQIVKDDLRNHKQSPSVECGTSNDVEMRSEPSLNRIETASSPIVQLLESNKENENDEMVQEHSPQDWVPAAESTASVVNDTSLLSKSEQEVLFKDRDALIFADLFSNGPAAEESPRSEENKSSRLSPDSPITFLQNGIDPSLRIKTYARRNRRPFVETKTISTQTSRYSLSGCPSPVTTIEENNSSKKDKYLLTEKDDDETFLRDIFNTADMPLRSGGSPRIRSPVYSFSTPAASTPVASTSSAVQNVTENLQSTADASEIGSAEVVVKRKRGRPRKYPLPDGATPVPKPPKSPRKPRQPKPPKEQSDEEVVFEKRVLRERKPKPVPVPVQPVVKERKPRKSRTRKEVETPPKPKPKRSGRRNTIKMTIDAIFNTQSPKLRAVQARRISQILGISINSPALATILKRRSYNKPINISKNLNSDSSVNESSMLQSFKNRTNGQMNSTSESTGQQNTQSTILARKTYIKPNITISSFSSFSSALRRLSFSSRRISFSSSMRHNRTNNSRKSHSQRYAKIDIFDTSKKRGRKKGQKDLVPRKRPNRKRKTEGATNISVDNKSNPIATQKQSIIEIGDKVNETIELVDLTNEVTPFELDTSAEMKNQFENIHTALSSTQHIQNDSESLAKRRNYPSEDTETDFTNEFTTDPESTVEDTDDSHTRKSKRSRKRPKILDL